MGYENRLKSKAADDLFEAMLTLETQEECYKFFEDLCTVSEARAMEQRFDVAVLLTEGKIYNEILGCTGASSATISRVSRMLSGGTGVLRSMTEQIAKEDEDK